MKNAALAILLAILPGLASASALDDALACTVSAHVFIGGLEQQQLIDAHPMRVESNSINAFSPLKGADLTAFGFHVFAVVGFEKDDPIFRTGDGEPLANSAYGAVVLGPMERVQAQVDAARSTALVHRVAPFVTAIFCKRS
jgi:hypothetical protein